ncbi:MAG: TRAM domain-containing protein [Ardenticatenaceae bacterium]|nr:TRAM domain-containing protein [Ardenticatenaceae bacterium]MCB8990609.1 TRAM domain-containing protein [Ardenticatenaceae bacterium]MCB9004316.1 TRAM domain-containing protein [Ardenticatenaceae bacterium]
MTLSSDFFSRIIGALGLGVGGGYLGDFIAGSLKTAPEPYIVVFALLGVLTGLILTPYVTVRPMRGLRLRLISMPPERLAAIVVGLFLGLVGAALFSLPLALLPAPFRHILPLVAAVIFCYLGVLILTMRQHDLKSFMANFRPIAQGESVTEVEEDFILLDTSVIIDGRIHDISTTGFLRGVLLIPSFVLQELQYIADSADPMRRNRGRRGLEVLRMLQEEANIVTRITDMDVSEVREVDSKLVSLARHLHCPIMTTDYNLNRVAEIQGVTVLNVNDLANSVKAAYLPGEELRVKIIQEGRESGQGVGYLEDGTMVVVEDAQRLLERTLDVTVTKVLQTSAGRMIFAKP